MATDTSRDVFTEFYAGVSIIFLCRLKHYFGKQSMKAQM